MRSNLLFRALRGSLVALPLLTGCTKEEDLLRSGYHLESGFPALPGSVTMGQAAGVATTPTGQVLVFHREESPILQFTPAGSYLGFLLTEKRSGAHGLRVDAAGHVWTTDIQRHTVTKHDARGRILLQLGEENVPGNDAHHFNQPTDVAFAPNGDFYVTDGYGNSRVLKFDARGQLLRQWGSAGAGPGQFNLPHAVQLDSQGRVYVADRENSRIQVFDEHGTYLRQLTGFTPYGLFITPDDVLFVADGRGNTVYKMQLDGTLLARWGQGPANAAEKELIKTGLLRQQPGDFSMPHSITVAPDGAVYVAEINGKRVQKFRE